MPQIIHSLKQTSTKVIYHLPSNHRFTHSNPQILPISKIYDIAQRSVNHSLVPQFHIILIHGASIPIIPFHAIFYVKLKRFHLYETQGPQLSQSCL